MKNRDISWRRYKIQEALCIGQCHLSPLQSRQLGTSHSSPSCHQLSHRIFLNLIDGLKSLPFQRWFLFWENPEVARCQIWAVVGLSHLRDFMFCQKTSQDLMHEQVCCCDEAANHQLPIAAAFLIIRIVSVEECSSLMQNLMQIHCSPHSVIWNVTATQNTCSLKGVYCPHWLVQWSRHCSCMCIPVHSPWLPGYTNMVQTSLVILPMAGLSLDKPHIPELTGSPLTQFTSLVKSFFLRISQFYISSLSWFHFLSS